MYTIICLQAGTLGKEGNNKAVIPGSGTPDIINASNTTNDGIIGRWHFRVDCSNATDCIGVLRSSYFYQLLPFASTYILTIGLR